MPTVTPNLWFDTRALEAAEFYWMMRMSKLDVAALERAADG